MGREVRMVPKNWKHPKRQDGGFIPLFDFDYQNCADDWDENCARWNTENSKKLSYSEWAGERPDKRDYMPTFKDGTATEYMMYETTSEGTPISPSFKTPEELASWLFENNITAFGKTTASYDGWLRIAEGGYACSSFI